VFHDLDDARVRLLLAAIVDSSDDAILSKDLGGIITSWNRAAEQLFRYTSEEIVGRSIRLIVPPDRQHEEDEVIAQVTAGGRVDHYETVRLRKDGSSVDVSLTVSPIRDATGTIVGASAIARDISDRVRTTDALTRAEATQRDLQQRLQALVAASGTLLKSPREAPVRQAVLQLAGELISADGYAIWQREPHSGTWRIMAHAGVSDAFAAVSVARAQANGAAPATLTEPIVAPDVQCVPTLAHRRAVYAREGVCSLLTVPLTVGGLPTATLALYYRRPHEFSPVEIETARALGNLAATALTTAELYQARRASEQRATFLARVSQVLATSLDSDERLQSVADMAVPRIADWCAIDLLDEGGEPQRVAVAHADPAKVDFAIEFARRFPSPPNVPDTVRSTIASGRPTLLPRITDEMLAAAALSPEHLSALRCLQIGSLIVVPLRTGAGILGALTLAASDREFTAVDLQFAENVASHIALAVANARTYRRLAAVNRTKDEFLAVLSHELRTPLNAVLGYTQMLRTGVVPEDRRDSALERVERNAATLAGMVAELLDMSRIVTGQLRVEMRTIELRSVMDDAVATVAPAAQAKGIRINVEDRSPGILVLADPDRLRQVLWNIMANAVKFTPRDGRVSVTLSHADDSVEIHVADTGPGISADSLARIFEPFLQGDQRPLGEHGGLGLGLAIARHLVEAHGGTILASSAGPGQGSCFTVRLPA